VVIVIGLPLPRDMGAVICSREVVRAATIRRPDVSGICL
jgi:hypothetical protein